MTDGGWRSRVVTSVICDCMRPEVTALLHAFDPTPFST
jgi:hypothetical protein